MYAVLDQQGRIIRSGDFVKLGTGTGEQLRYSAAKEIQAGYKIVNIAKLLQPDKEACIHVWKPTRRVTISSCANNCGAISVSGKVYWPE